MKLPICLRRGIAGPSVLAAILLAAWGGARACRADPPSDSAWKMTFSDEFERGELDLQKWAAESNAPGHVRSARRPENVEVREGVCRLYNRKEKFLGRTWTGGYIWSREFEQKGGYFEARVKIAAAAGLNNGFWLTPDGRPQTAGYFEIDVAANYYPDNLETYANNLDVGKREILAGRWKAPVNLSKDYHVYALLWTDTELVWYFDGKEIRRTAISFCRRPARVRFSTAVTPYGGPESDAIDGTSMDLDYVRVFKKLEKIPSAVELLNGVQ